MLICRRMMINTLENMLKTHLSFVNAPTLRRTVHPSALLPPDVITLHGFCTWMRNVLESAGVNTKLSSHTQPTPIIEWLILALCQERTQNINQFYVDNCRIASALMRNPTTLPDRQLGGEPGPSTIHKLPSRDIDWELDSGVSPDSASVI